MNICKSIKIATILYMLSMVRCVSTSTQAQNSINFSKFKNTISNQTITRTQQLQITKFLHKELCTYSQEKQDKYLVRPVCLLENNLPKIEFGEAIEYLRPHISSFNTIYNEHETTFVYEGTSPLFQHNYNVSITTANELMYIAQLQKSGVDIRIDKSTVAYNSIKNANFYVVYRNISSLKRCTKQNYFVAANILNNTILEPGETLNLNKKIANAAGYCKGSGPQNLMFYGGVCGLATQLFKAALLSPEIKITKRHPHSRRLVPYYSEYIYGDDAAIYEMNKEFEIQNIGEHPLYFKLLEKNNGVFLAIITPQKSNEGVLITKKQTKTLNANVEKTTYTQRPELVTKIENFPSKYTKKIYSTW